jgi:hypothetical protein
MIATHHANVMVMKGEKIIEFGKPHPTFARRGNFQSGRMK